MGLVRDIFECPLHPLHGSRGLLYLQLRHSAFSLLFFLNISTLDWHIIMTNLSDCSSAFSVLNLVAKMSRLIVPLLIQVSAVFHRFLLAMAC